MVPMTANQNSQCVALRGGRGDQPAVSTCPAIYPPPIAIAAAQSLAFLHQRAKMNISVAATAAARAADGSICFSNCKSIGSRKLPLLLNAFQAQDDRDLVPDRALLEVHAEVASLYREARFAPPRVSPNTPLPSPPFLKSTVSGLVTPRIVRSPETLSVSPLPSIFVLLKVIVGNCFASKKSGLFRLRSRIELCVSRLSTGTDNSTELFEGLSLSKTTVPEMSLKRP